MPQPKSTRRSILIEIAWLLGSWAFSWLLLGRLWGSLAYLSFRTIEVQQHNNYYVFQPLLLTTLLFLPVATVVTGVRVSVAAFRHLGSNAVLVSLAGIWSLIMLLAVAGWALH